MKTGERTSDLVEVGCSNKPGGPRGRILSLVHQFERLNASVSGRAGSLDAEIKSISIDVAEGAKHVNKNYTDNDNLDNIDDEELCFKAAQLITELLLMLFAFCLLIIALVVIFSKKVPPIMESYEVIPKFLFFLCLIVASCSFTRWLVHEIKKLVCHRGQAGGVVERESCLEPEVEVLIKNPSPGSKEIELTTTSSNEDDHDNLIYGQANIGCKTKNIVYSNYSLDKIKPTSASEHPTNHSYNYNYKLTKHDKEITGESLLNLATSQEIACKSLMSGAGGGQRSSINFDQGRVSIIDEEA